jgi:hypothetical protein
MSQTAQAEPGTLTCRRCGSVSPVKNRPGKFTCPYCEKCRTPEELRQDLGCDTCLRSSPRCIGPPGGYVCPLGVF